MHENAVQIPDGISFIQNWKFDNFGRNDALLGGCQAGGSIWKETISLEPKDKTVSEETLDPETDIDRQVE